MAAGGADTDCTGLGIVIVQPCMAVPEKKVVAHRASYLEKVFVKLIFDSMSAGLMSQI